MTAKEREEVAIEIYPDPTHDTHWERERVRFLRAGFINGLQIAEMNEHRKSLEKKYAEIHAQQQVKKCDLADVGERSTGRITVSFFRKVYKQFIDEKISMTKMLELMTEQAHRTDVCVKCQRQLDGTNVSKTKCNACFTVNA